MASDIKFYELEEKYLKEVASLYDGDSSKVTDVDKMAEVFKRIKDDSFYEMIVAKIDEEIVGFAYVNIHQDIFEECKPFMSVWSVRVKKEYRRRKVGTKLFNYIEERARELDCSFISLIAEEGNRGANEFYKAIGYSKEVGYVKFLG